MKLHIYVNYGSCSIFNSFHFVGYYIDDSNIWNYLEKPLHTLDSCAFVAEELPCMDWPMVMPLVDYPFSKPTDCTYNRILLSEFLFPKNM